MNCQSPTRISHLAGAAALLFAVTAYAQQAPEDTTPPPSTGPATDEQPPTESLPPCPSGEQAAAPAPPPAPPPAKHHNRIFAPQEVSLTTGAGPANYFGSSLNSSVDVGAGWDARVTFGAHSAIALEAAYVGSSNSIDTADRTQHGRLDSHGFDSDLRLQLPTVVQPYIFGGVGYNHMAVTQTSSVSSAGPLTGGDDQVTVPAGAGLTGYLGKHTTLDLRGTYRYIPDNGITVMSTSSLHQWVAQAHVGYVF
jgi:hypothetical protein